MNELHLFAGSGGGILGGMLLGHTCVCAVENNTHAISTLLARQRDGLIPRFPIWGDVRTFNGSAWAGRVDVVCGGFPCTDISQIKQGAEGIDGDESGLWSEMARVVDEVRPKFVFAENSPMLVRRGLGRVLCDLSRLGYDARWCVLGARHAGAPHIRDRLWILGHSKRERLERHDGDGKNTEGREIEDRPDFPAGILVRGWKRVVYAADCAADLDDSNGLICPECGEEYAECQCPGPTMDELTYQYRSDGLYAKPTDPWSSESGVLRVVDGLANRMDRHRIERIGNGQVPAVVALAWRILSTT